MSKYSQNSSSRLNITSEDPERAGQALNPKCLERENSGLQNSLDEAFIER